jgi:hypothetical protein
MKKEGLLQMMRFDVEDFLKEADEAEDFVKVTKRILREQSQTLIDKSAQQASEDWSALSNQVVGSEVF